MTSCTDTDLLTFALFAPFAPLPLCPFAATVPSCGPTNVSAFATTSSSILVRWGDVPQPDRNGLILGYKVGNPQ